MNKMLIAGSGGHCKSVLDTLKELKRELIGILDVKEKVGSRLQDIPVIGTDNDLEYFYQQGIRVLFIAIGSIGNPEKRIQIYKKAKEIGYYFPIIIDRTAVISQHVVIGEGTFIGKGVIINTQVEIGRNTIINTGSIIEHDCIIEDFVHIAPGTTLSGEVHVKKNSHIGTHATVIQNITIGSNTMIGAGSSVVEDIKDNAKAYGNPCRAVT